jgi:hypothetical protein
MPKRWMISDNAVGVKPERMQGWRTDSWRDGNLKQKAGFDKVVRKRV